jgi:glutathione-specific gamma-glutamylcyclotransferase
MRDATLALTPELVALAHRIVVDAGPAPDVVLHSDADYDAIVARIIAEAPAGGDLWLFAYGSLIWKPEVEHVEERMGVAAGWHRSFCFRVARFRGTVEQPGLMMALDRGGQCRGALFRLGADDPTATLGRLFRREFTSKPANSVPRWIKVRSQTGPLTALAFVMNRKSPSYLGRLRPDEVAEILASACGHWGSGAEYLHNTVRHLADRGIYDRNLWRLQKLVAARLDARRVPSREGGA